MDSTTPSADDPVLPVMVVDAGGEPWERVEPLLARRMHELPAGGLLQVHASEPEVHRAIPQWCSEHGYLATSPASEDTPSMLHIRHHVSSPLELP